MTSRLILLQGAQWLLFNLLGVGAFGVLEGDIEDMMISEKVLHPTDAERKARAEQLWHEWHGADAHHCAGKAQWSGYSEGWCGREVKNTGDLCFLHRLQQPGAGRKEPQR